MKRAITAVFAGAALVATGVGAPSTDGASRRGRGLEHATC